MNRQSLAGLATLVTFMVCAGSSAWAQASTAKLLDAAVSECLAANTDKANPPAHDIAVCEPAIAKIDAIYAAIPAPAPHETNLRHMYRAFVETAIGGGYAQIDAVRSARVCTQAEASWAELTQIIDASSPASIVVSYEAMRTSAIRALTKCRAEKGTPPGAAPLPPG